MQHAVRKYLKALAAGDADRAAALFTSTGWVQSPFLGKIPVREYVAKVAAASGRSELTVHDVLVSAEGHMRAVAYYLYDWRLKDDSRVSFECADVFPRSCSCTTRTSSETRCRTNILRDVRPGGASLRHHSMPRRLVRSSAPLHSR